MLAIRRRDNGKWEPPGGTLEPTESILQGLRREVHEETGITISDPRLSGVYKNMTQGIVALVFHCRHNGEVPHPTDEVEEVTWMTPVEVKQQLDPAFACRLLDALKNEDPAVRAHDGVEILDDHG